MATYYGSWVQASKGAVEKFRMKIVTSYSQNVANNSSTITIKQYIEGASHTSWGDEVLNGGGSTDSVKLVGDGVSQTKKGNWYWSDNGSKLIQSKTWTKKHNSDGKASFSFSGSCTMWLHQVWRDSSGRLHESGEDKTVSIGSTTVSLPQIAQGSKVSAGSSQITFGNSITFSINRNDSSFKHTLTAELYGHKEQIGSDIGTSKTWTVPTGWIQYTPDNANPKITVTCKTYKGSSKIGSDSTCTFNCKVPETSEYYPTCSITVEEDNQLVKSKNLNFYIQNLSQIKGTITAQEATGGSAIKTYTAAINDVIYSTRIFTTMPLKYNGDNALKFKVSDSRGRSSTENEQNIIAVEYFAPTIEYCKVERCDSSGTLNEEGSYGKATIKYNAAPLSYGGQNNNSITLKVYYGNIVRTYSPSNFNGTYVFSGNSNLFNNLSTTDDSSFTFIIEDIFHKESEGTAIKQSFVLPPSFVTMSLKGNGGRGVTFGRSASKEGLISYMDAELHGDNWAKNMSVDGLVTEKYSEGSWITYAE